MPLDDREQRILAEIERQFYLEDPELATAVRNIERPSKRRVRLPAVGVVVGLAIAIATFTRVTWVAVAGFLLMVVSATVLVQSLGARVGADSAEQRSSPAGRWWPFSGDG